MRYVHSMCLVLFVFTASLQVEAGWAQPSDTTSSDSASVDTASLSVTKERPKSPGQATALSLVGTVVPAGVGAIGSNGPLIISGVLLGPAFGHIYAQNNTRALTGILLRGGGIALSGIGAIQMATSQFNGADGTGGSGGGTILLIGAIATVGSAVVDIAQASNAVQEYNQKHGLKSLRVSPAVGGLQGEEVGLSVVLQF